MTTRPLTTLVASHYWELLIHSVPCSDLPGPNMEILPSCSVSPVGEQGFALTNDSLTNDSSAFTPSEDSLTYGGTLPGGGIPPGDEQTFGGGIPPGGVPGGGIPPGDEQTFGGGIPPGGWGEYRLDEQTWRRNTAWR